MIMKNSVNTASNLDGFSAYTLSDHSAMNTQVLRAQNHNLRGTAGVSQENHSLGFRPAFRDSKTGLIYMSRFANGTIAPVHMLDGLPQELVVNRTSSGKVVAVKDSVTAGFVLKGQFYTREQAAFEVLQNNQSVTP
jgi:hypothetical protein